MPYDEFGLFHENAAEYGLPYAGPPAVRRVDVEVSPGRRVSSLLWGTSPPELVLVHGGAQNAHTWDTVALALGRPLLAIDLPGHGHSDGPGSRPAGQLNAVGNATDVATALGGRVIAAASSKESNVRRRRNAASAMGFGVPLGGSTPGATMTGS